MTPGSPQSGMFPSPPQAPAEGTGLGPALFTIDLEDYFQVAAFRNVVRPDDWRWYPSRVEGNVSRLLDLLAEFRIKATWFVLGWEAAQRPAMIRRIAESGHELACHSFSHQEVFLLSPEKFREDTLAAKEAIEDASGFRVTGYRAPSFSITRASLWALEVLIEQGFEYDSSIFPVWHPNYGIPGARPYPFQLKRHMGGIWELPPATVPLFGRRWSIAGGAYLRHLPFWWCWRGLRYLVQKEKIPAVLYLHPWEIDPDQPRLAVGTMTRIRHYRNLKRTMERVRTLLAAFDYSTCGALVQQLKGDANAESAPAVVANPEEGELVEVGSPASLTLSMEHEGGHSGSFHRPTFFEP